MKLDLLKFKHLSQISADNAANSLTKFTGIKTKINIVSILLNNLTNKFEGINDDSFVTSIQLPISGDVNGSTLILFSNNVAMQLSKILTKQTSSSVNEFTDIEVSALKEVANILCGSFFTVMSNQLKIHIVEHLPLFSFKNLSTTLQDLHAKLHEDNAILIQINFELQDSTVLGYIIFVFGFKEIQLLSEKLRLYKI